MYQVNPDPVTRSATFSVIHVVCIIMLAILMVSTYKRYKEKQRMASGDDNSKKSPLILILLEFELVLLVGFIFQNLSSDIFWYIRVQQVINTGYSNPALQVVMEHLNMWVQAILAVFIYLLAIFSNKLFFFKGKKYNKINLYILCSILVVLSIGIFVGFAWEPANPITGKRNPQLWVMVVNGAYLGTIIIPALTSSFKAYKKATNNVERGGTLFITLFLLFIILMIVFQAIFQLTLLYFFSYASWLMIPLGIAWAYFGLIMPKGLRRYLENR